MKELDFKRDAEALKNKGLTDERVIKDLLQHKAETPYMQQRKYPTEMYDKVNLMCRKYMDRLARFEVDYGFEINEEKFKNTLICCLECAPFMHSQVINNPIAPYWRVADYHINDVVIVKHVDDIDTAREEFFKIQIPLKSNVQIKIGLYYCNGNTYVLFIWNHMLFDGGGYKAFWYDFCRNYTEYDLNGVSPVAFSSGSRSYKEVYKDMDKETLKAAKKQLANVSPKIKRTMPFRTLDKTNEIIIVSRQVEAENFQRAVEYAKDKGATVTDLLIAAFINALAKITDMPTDEAVSIACATDLRRHIKDLSTLGYTNHVSFSHCSIEGTGASFDTILERVSTRMKEIKSDPFMGLHGLPLLNFAYKAMTYIQAENAVKMFYNNPVFSVSNVGAVDRLGFDLSGNSPISAFVAGAAKNKPCAVMTALTVNGKLSASMCLRGNADDKEVLESFFTIFKNTIEGL
ncbi:MAG: hypothetical protein IKV44_02665 [Clostridia bacterium]|nr:hypothetical protein [Clostridia bacterium]